ncbi:MAG: hypothetical protein CVU90_08860 [Firmicutes bacterium HGW-Firmicutes-15]|nr:MAG: hypothetical protein CVU90_08860 [Firmicutes bacterium HGW-Firmicutes-15]
MSIITVCCVPEGIAMAADSRLTGQKNYPNGMVDRFAISDNSQKLFLLTKTKVGISFCGAAIIDGRTISDVIRIFEIEDIDEDDTVSDVAEKLHRRLIETYKGHELSFFVAGYRDEEPYVYSIWPGGCERNNASPEGDILYRVNFNGEYEALEKLLNGNIPTQFNFPLMPLKDALDFSEFLVDVVIKYQRFEDRVATCGGPIDSLIITKDYARFVKHKIFNI